MRPITRPLNIYIPLVAISVIASAWSAAAAETSDKPDASATSERGCKVVERKPSDDKSKSGSSNSGSMSSSITAGGGSVSGYTTGSGQSVTVHSGNGRSSSSVATAGGSGGSTVVAGSGNGDCVIFVDPGKKEDSK